MKEIKLKKERFPQDKLEKLEILSILNIELCRYDLHGLIMYKKQICNLLINDIVLEHNYCDDLIYFIIKDDFTEITVVINYFRNKQRLKRAIEGALNNVFDYKVDLNIIEIDEDEFY